MLKTSSTAYCSDSIIKCLKSMDVRVFHAFMEDWKKVQLDRKGGDVHAAWVSTKYGELNILIVTPGPMMRESQVLWQGLVNSWHWIVQL